MSELINFCTDNLTGSLSLSLSFSLTLSCRHKHARTRAHMHARARTHTHTHTYTHTHTHTQTDCDELELRNRSNLAMVSVFSRSVSNVHGEESISGISENRALFDRKGVRFANMNTRSSYRLKRALMSDAHFSPAPSTAASHGWLGTGGSGGIMCGWCFNSCKAQWKEEEDKADTEREVGKQHKGMDRPGVRQVPEGSGEQKKKRKKKKNRKKLFLSHMWCPNNPRS